MSQLCSETTWLWMFSSVSLLLDDIAEKGCGHTDILKPIEMIGDDVTSERKRPCTVYVVYVWRRMWLV